MRSVVLVGFEPDVGISGRGGEVPHTVVCLGVGEAPHQFLDGVVVRQADLLGTTVSSDGIGTGVLHLLDQVFMTLLGEPATLFGVQVDVVGPHLEHILVQVGGEGGRDVDVDAHFMVLKGDQRQVQSGVPVEEEDEGKVDGAGGSSGHLSPGSLLGFVQVKLRVQTPPFLVVLVDALTTDGKLNVVDRTLGDPVAVISGVHGGGVGGERLQFEVHITDKVTVTGNSHGDATGVSGSTVDGLLDVLHREVGVTLVFRLVEGNFGVTGKVDVLSAVSYELHETTSHFESCCTLYRENNSE